jgi:hypothetical protein
VAAAARQLGIVAHDGERLVARISESPLPALPPQRHNLFAILALKLIGNGKERA